MEPIHLAPSGGERLAMQTPWAVLLLKFSDQDAEPFGRA
jgi:hypothetical protein